MKLERTSAILSEIEAASQTLTEIGAVQNFLAQYAAIALYSEMEEKVAEIVKSRLGLYTHPLIVTFITTSMDDIIRRTPKI